MADKKVYNAYNFKILSFIAVILSLFFFSLVYLNQRYYLKIYGSPPLGYVLSIILFIILFLIRKTILSRIIVYTNKVEFSFLFGRKIIYFSEIKNIRSYYEYRRFSRYKVYKILYNKKALTLRNFIWWRKGLVKDFDDAMDTIRRKCDIHYENERIFEPKGPHKIHPYFEKLISIIAILNMILVIIAVFFSKTVEYIVGDQIFPTFRIIIFLIFVISYLILLVYSSISETISEVYYDSVPVLLMGIGGGAIIGALIQLIFLKSKKFGMSHPAVWIPGISIMLLFIVARHWDKIALTFNLLKKCPICKESALDAIVVGNGPRNYYCRNHLLEVFKRNFINSNSNIVAFYPKLENKKENYLYQFYSMEELKKYRMEELFGNIVRDSLKLIKGTCEFCQNSAKVAYFGKDSFKWDEEGNFPDVGSLMKKPEILCRSCAAKKISDSLRLYKGHFAEPIILPLDKEGVILPWQV